MNAFVKLIRSVGAAAASAKRQSKEEKKKANESKIQSIRTQIGVSIGNAFPTTPTADKKKGGKRRHSTDDGSISSVDDSLGSSISSRRRKTSIQSVASDDVSLDSIGRTPRRGFKKKRSKSSAKSAPQSARSAPSSILVHRGSSTPAMSCQEYPQPTINFLGWRRLHLHEVVSLTNDDSLMLIIPSDARREDESLKSNRANLRFRLLRHVKPFFDTELLGISADSKFQKLELLLNERHGIRRNKSISIELFAQWQAILTEATSLYETISSADIKDHIKKGAGIELKLVDYPGSTLLLKWKELASVQVFVEMHHGDECVPLTLSSRKQLHFYCDDIRSMHDEIKGDPIQELRLANEVLKKEVQLLKIQISKAATVSAAPDYADNFEADLELELDGGSLNAFALRTDMKYKEAWLRHYSNPFQSLGRILGSDDIADSIVEDIRDSFPKHYAVLVSLFFSKRSHEPVNKAKPSYKERMRSLATHFLAIVRVRNPHHLMHWAITGTMAMFHAGIP
ncbi:hypothetical protein THAOC_02945, partial [Thalassiosira oceanica]